MFLLYNTLSERLKRDLVWNLIVGKYAVPFCPGNGEKTQGNSTRSKIKKRDFNNIVIDSLMKIPLQKTSSTQIYISLMYIFPIHPCFL
jgi:hypothetical protein